MINDNPLDRELNLTLTNGLQLKNFIPPTLKDFNLATAYELMPLPVMRADVLRYAVLSLYGGLYVDTDTLPIAPIESGFLGPLLWS